MSSDVLCMGTATVTDGIIQLLCTNHIRDFTTLQKNSSVSTYVYTQPLIYHTLASCILYMYTHTVCSSLNRVFLYKNRKLTQRVPLLLLLFLQ